MDPITIAMALAQVAPKIIGWISGPNAEEAAHKIVGIAQSVTSEEPPDRALSSVLNNPDYKKEFQKAILDNSRELDLAYLADRQNARSREIDTRRLPWEMWGLAAFIIIGLLVMGVALFTVAPPTGSHDILLIVVGALVARVGDVYGYYFGGSKGSDEKTRLLANRMK